MEDFDHQGKRIEQVEFSYHIIGYSILGLMIIGLVYSVLSLF